MLLLLFKVSYDCNFLNVIILYNLVIKLNDAREVLLERGLFYTKRQSLNKFWSPKLFKETEL